MSEESFRERYDSIIQDMIAASDASLSSNPPTPDTDLPTNGGISPNVAIWLCAAYEAQGVPCPVRRRQVSSSQAGTKFECNEDDYQCVDGGDSLTPYCISTDDFQWYNMLGYSGSVLTNKYTTPEGEDGNLLEGQCPGDFYNLDESTGYCVREVNSVPPEGPRLNPSSNPAGGEGIPSSTSRSAVASSEPPLPTSTVPSRETPLPTTTAAVPDQENNENVQDSSSWTQSPSVSAPVVYDEENAAPELMSTESLLFRALLGCLVVRLLV